MPRHVLRICLLALVVSAAAAAAAGPHREAPALPARRRLRQLGGAPGGAAGRVEGGGRFGSLFAELLQRINANAAGRSLVGRVLICRCMQPTTCTKQHSDPQTQNPAQTTPHLSPAVPRAGSFATSDSAADGSPTAGAQHASVAGLQSSPLRTGGLGRAGGAAAGPDAARAGFAAGASSVAKGIVGDSNSTGERLAGTCVQPIVVTPDTHPTITRTHALQ
jgi:hypothetical protein